MSAVLEVAGLCKEYPKFRLDNVSFRLEKGEIIGFIGRNGAGKTTTIKAMLNLISRSAGDIKYFGLDLDSREREIKGRVGYAGGAVDYYKKKKIASIMKVTKRFYPGWDEGEYRKYMKLFELDEEKTPSELSEGMKVKLNLAAALSHGAELLILDEPTSGLDPVSRGELLEIFSYLARQGKAIFFSTHITTDIEKCADSITYIREGRIAATGPLAQFMEREKAAGRGERLEDIMLSYEKEALHEKFAD